MRHHLRLHGFFHVGGALEHQLIPLLHSLLRFFQEAAVFLALQHRDKFFQGSAAVAYQSDLYRITQSDLDGIKINLHRFSLARFRQKLNIRK